MIKNFTTSCLIGFLLAQSGCEVPVAPPPPKPTIMVEQFETNESSSLKVSYVNHYWSTSEQPHIIINNLDELNHYRKEVEFLMKRLDEAEQKMNIREPEAPVDQKTPSQ